MYIHKSKSAYIGYLESVLSVNGNINSTEKLIDKDRLRIRRHFSS